MAEYRAAGTEVTVWSVGKKAPSFLRFRGIEVAESFTGVADRPEFSDARRIAAIVAAPFVSGEIDLVQMISTRFISAGTQRVERMQMLPLPLPEEAGVVYEEDGAPEGYTEFEPEPAKLLEKLAPRALEAEIFAALLEGCGGVLHRAAARHGGRHRERGRARPHPDPRHEPRPSGRHHHRDHGDRRRGRGAPPFEGSLTA